jgi:hypothetical protein
MDQYGIRIGDKTVSLEKVVMVVAEAELNMHCISCSSPVLLEMSDFFQSPDGVKDTTRGKCFERPSDSKTHHYLI